MRGIYQLLGLVLCLSTTILVKGQPSPDKTPLKDAKGIIMGKVIDASTSTPLEYSNISIHSAQDSSLVTGGLTDATGSFQVPVSAGNYYVIIDYISFDAITIGDVKIDRNQNKVDLGVIQLKATAESLGEVEVRAEKSSTQIMLDKKVFNVGQDLANMGGSAENILDNVPSVTVDIEGNVSLRGNQNVRILVDGRPSGLVGLGNTNGLRQIPANMIDKVEVITNPSSKYEAEGTVGIINIILKKNRRKGLNGSFDFNLGYNGSPGQVSDITDEIPGSMGGAVNLNYRKKDLNFFVNTGFRYRKRPGGGYTNQEFYLDDGTTLLTQMKRAQIRGGYSGNVRLGADYYITPKDIITTSFLYRYSEENNYSQISYADYMNDLNNPLGLTLRTDNELEIDPNLEYVLSYDKKFSQKGRKFTADFRFQTNTETENSILSEYFDLNEMPNPDVANTVKDQRSSNNEGERVFIIQSDYTHPFNKNGRIEVGYRGAIRQIRNNYLVEEMGDNNDWQTIETVSNDFNYDENIQALYANIGDKIKKFSYQFGMRYEYSFISTKLLNTGEVNERTYPLPFFPSMFLSYDLPNENAIQLSYSRRLRRPRFRELNPFFSFTDARNRYSGNPNLDPEFTHSIELNHIKYWKKATVTSSIYYRRTNGNRERIRSIAEVIENGDTLSITITQPQNLTQQDAYGVEFTYNFNPYKWWRINGNVNLYRFVTDGSNIGSNFYADNFSWFTRLTSQFTVMKTMDIQLRFNYRAPRENTQGASQAMYHLDLGISQDIFNNNGTITLSVRDLFNSRRWNYETFGEEFYMIGEYQRRARSITLSLNYRLNQKKKRSRRGGGNGDGGDYGGEF